MKAIEFHFQQAAPVAILYLFATDREHHPSTRHRERSHPLHAPRGSALGRSDGVPKLRALEKMDSDVTEARPAQQRARFGRQKASRAW